MCRIKPKTSPKKQPSTPESDSRLSRELQLQESQHSFHQRYVNNNINEGDPGIIKINRKLYKCATPFDINLSLQLGFRNAIDWANQYSSFRNLLSRNKKLVLSEFGIAFLLVDQAFKSAHTTRQDFWVLQNDSFLHPEMVFKTDGANLKEDTDQMRSHSEFVYELVNVLKKPFKILEINAMECAFLKTILLFTPSYLKRVNVDDTDGIVARCKMELMKISTEKSPEDGMTRFGEVILLLGSIRSTVKSYYNQTKASDLFDITKFDVFVRNNFLA